MTPLKRFLVFSYDDYYPSGGRWDQAESFDTLEEALAFVANDKASDNHDILDLQDRVWIEATEGPSA